MSRVTAADILKVVPITRKTLWLWQKKYKFFPDPVKEAHPGGKGIVGYYPAWVEERCKKVYALQKKGYTIAMIKEILQQEKENQSARKILIVDDEKKFSNLLKKFFEKNNFVTELAYDGWDAGLKAAQFMPSIIILDIALPGINGMEVCKNLKENAKTANIKVIAISGDLRHSEKVILDAGADIYFTKPVDFDTLLTVCNEFVGQIENT
jgi:CheY-like chemotaxis protein